MFLSTVVVILLVSLTSIVNCEDADCNNDDEGEHCCLSCCPCSYLSHQYYIPEGKCIIASPQIYVQAYSYILVTEISKNSLRCS